MLGETSLPTLRGAQLGIHTTALSMESYEHACPHCSSTEYTNSGVSDVGTGREQLQCKKCRTIFVPVPFKKYINILLYKAQDENA